MLDLKQPLLGIAASAIIILISLVFISLFDFPRRFTPTLVHPICEFRSN